MQGSCIGPCSGAQQSRLRASLGVLGIRLKVSALCDTGQGTVHWLCPTVACPPVRGPGL